jgi:TRAP-type C4-dicarboxylate transport system substrate-binding protein
MNIPYLALFMPRVARHAVAALAFAGVALSAQRAGAQEIVMKFATQTINDIQHEYMKVFKTELEARTQGRIKVELYPASQLGGSQRQTEGLRLGTIEAAIGPAELFVGADKRYQGLAMTGLWKDITHARRVLDKPEVRELITSIGNQRGIVTIGTLVYDMQMFDTKQPVTKLSDLQGRRIRVLASDTEQAAIQALGGSSIPMSLQEVMPALQQGTIDGVSSVLGAFTALRFYDAAPHITDTKLWALIPLALVSKVWFDKLPPDLQQAVRETGQNVEPAIHKWQVDRIVADRETWAKNNGKIVTLPPAEQAEAEKRVVATVDPILAKDPPLKAFYEKLRSLAQSVN